MRISIAQINPTIGDLKGNSKKIISFIHKAKEAGAQIVLFPELALTGYPPDDLLLLPHFIKAADQKLREITLACEDIYAIVGVPRYRYDGKKTLLFNSAAIINNGKLLDFYDKMLLPTYDVFDERRYFEPGSDLKMLIIGEHRVAITICEDIWKNSELVHFAHYQRDPVSELSKHNPDLLLNLSASPYSIDKFPTRLQVCQAAAKKLHCPVILCNQVGGNDSLIFDGYSIYVTAKGLIKSARGFAEELLTVDTSEQEVTEPQRHSLEDLYQALLLGIRDYSHKLGFTKACLGISGGIDSALVACLGVDALGASNILGIIMPSRYSSKETQDDARLLAERLGIDFEEVSIEAPFTSILSLLTPYFQGKEANCTEENFQARIRGMILMGFSNKFGHLLLSTGNKSELAVGYSTLYGDMCGGLMAIGDLTKHQVYNLSRWINRKGERIPLSIIAREPSAELKPNQKDSDSLPPYPILDQIVKDYVEKYLSPEEIIRSHEYTPEIVYDLIQRIHRSEYKRHQSPPVLRISDKAFSSGRRFPIVQKWI